MISYVFAFVSSLHAYSYVSPDFVSLQNAEYQREVVWNDDQMRGLIDSLLGNFYVPPVLIAVNSETLKRTCIDGKQRLTAIHK